jgi:mRNA interferase MazF
MKLSVSLEPPLVAFLTTYQQRHGLKSRSSVLEAALRLLAEREAEAELAAAYAASAEQDAALAREAQATWNDGLAMRRGEIYFAALDPTVGAEVQKTRPVVVVSNNAANRASSVVTVVPLTSNVARVFPFEVLLPAARTGLTKDSKAMAQQVRTLDKARLNARAAGQLQPADAQALDAALRLHLAL